MLIELAKAGDLAAIAALLREAGLPNADLDAGKLEHFLVLRGADSTTVSGAVGFEPHGSAALLRSLVVAPAQRGGGHGEALVGAVEARARRSGVAELYLLTTTADAFFARLGYVKIARDTALAALQSTSEFATLCPASAICMHKAL